ncbi:MAG: hypothetical protein FD130_2323, partial [Halothiobacillaceae bacterium]
LPLGVEDDSHIAGVVVVEQPLEHINDTINRASRFAMAVAQRWQGVKGAVEIRGAVHQE